MDATYTCCMYRWIMYAFHPYIISCGESRLSRVFQISFSPGKTFHFLLRGFNGYESMFLPLKTKHFLLLRSLNLGLISEISDKVIRLKF